jgi:hypothetical protein
MIKEYPGNPARRDAIQADIKATTGTSSGMMRCTCGKPPYIVSPRAGRIAVTCVCGFHSKTFARLADAINDWNHQVTSLFLESIR